jgi:hypothetical protein
MRRNRNTSMFESGKTAYMEGVWKTFEVMAVNRNILIHGNTWECTRTR